MFAGVEAGAAVLAHPPEGQCAEDGDGRIDGGTGGEGLEDIGPDYGVPIQHGGAVREPLIDVLSSGSFEGGKSHPRAQHNSWDARSPIACLVNWLSVTRSISGHQSQFKLTLG